MTSQYNLYAGYAGDVINDDAIYDGPYELNQLTYNYDVRQRLHWRHFVGRQQFDTSDSDSYGGAWVTSKALTTTRPTSSPAWGYTTGTLGLKVVGGYDSIVEEGAVKARIDAKFGGVEAFLMGGWNTDGDKLNQYAGSYQDESACTTLMVLSMGQSAAGVIGPYGVALVSR